MIPKDWCRGSQVAFIYPFRHGHTFRLHVLSMCVYVYIYIYFFIYYIILYYIILYYTILYYIILYYTHMYTYTHNDVYIDIHICTPAHAYMQTYMQED